MGHVDLISSNCVPGFLGHYTHFQSRLRDGILVQRVHTVISNAEMHRIGDFIRGIIQESICGENIKNGDYEPGVAELTSLQNCGENEFGLHKAN